MKKVKRLFALILVCALVAVSMTGCRSKGKKENRDGTEIEINYWNAGLGSAWLDEVIAAFEAKYPEYYVTVNATANASAVAPAYGLASTDTVDLYLYIYQEQTEYMEPLNDILETTIEGESKSIGEKFQQTYLDAQIDEDGKYYGLTYGGGIIGIVYNEKLFEQAGIDIAPRTTKELTYACDALYENGITPFCHFSPQGYWTWLNEVFFAQYCGFDYYKNNFYACVDENGNALSKDVVTNEKDGRYATLKALEEFVTPEYTLQGSNTYDHATMQTKFLQGDCAMMVNGSWFETEMDSAGSAENMVMMRTPVISSIVDKLETVKKESELIKLVTAIDSVTDGEKALEDYWNGSCYVVEDLEVSEHDWEYVDLARNSVANNFSSSTAFIPNYSDTIDGAKQFLKYLYSDEGYQVYLNALGTTLPMDMSDAEADLSAMSKYGKQIYDLSNSTKQFITMEMVSRHVVYKETMVRSFGVDNFITSFTTKNTGERKKATEYWDFYVDNINKNWDEWLLDIK